jgi:hypothetical protein
MMHWSKTGIGEREIFKCVVDILPIEVYRR